jgi:dihydropyrimidinase
LFDPPIRVVHCVILLGRDDTSVLGPANSKGERAVSVLIKNGRVVTASDDYYADVFVNGSQIAVIGKELVIAADKTIDAKGKLVIPGGVDPHTHLEMPFGGTTTSDTFETGTRAAAHGGTTTIIDFAIQARGTSTLKALDDWHAKAEGKTAIDYAFHMIVTDMPQGRIGEMRRLADAGVTSYKLFMAYPGALLSDDGTIFRAMRKAGEDGTLVCMHAENGIVIDELVKAALEQRLVEPKYHALTRPTRLEAEGVYRALAIAEVARSPVYIVHLSCYDALHELRMAQARGVMAHAETCPQYLLLDIERYDEPGFDGAKYVLTPPLRERWNQEELWGGLRSHALDVISTDHCPFCLREQKELGRDDFSKIPNGGPGIESRMSLIYHNGVGAGRISLNRFVELTSTAPAKIFGLFPKKGTIAIGSDADIVIFDPEREETISVYNGRTHHANIDYSAFEGFKVKGYTETVLSRGRVIIENGTYVGRAGDGAFLRRRPYGGHYANSHAHMARDLFKPRTGLGSPRHRHGQ